jgi:two-component system, OmpR family, KDP operon response regulator KdpE
MSAGDVRVLVVDDEPQIVRGLKVILGNAGYRVEEATTKQEALDSVSARPPDAIVLDLVLPDGDGVDVATEIRRWSQVPIVVLSAVGDEHQKVRALDAGADDYVTKPFGSEELLARMRAVLRRRSEDGNGPVRIGDLEVDLADRSVKRAGEEVHLTPIEFDLPSIRVGWSPTASSCRRSGARATRTRPTTCGFTSRTCGRSSSPTHPTPPT